MWTRLVASSLLVLCIVPLVAAKPAGFAADITLIWVEADGEVSDTVKLATDKVYGGDLALDHTQELQIKFKALLDKGKSVEPEQAMVRFSCESTGRDVYFGASSDGEYLLARVKYADLEDAMGGPDEAFGVSLLLGNAQPAIATELKLADIACYRPGADSVKLKKREDGLASIAKVKPEIVHTHRQPEKQAPAAISFAFAGIVFAPAGMFVSLGMLTWISVKAPSAYGMRFIGMCVFHAGVAAILVVQMLFWLRLNLLQALAPLAALEVATLLIGIQVASVSPIQVKQD